MHQVKGWSFLASRLDILYILDDVNAVRKQIDVVMDYVAEQTIMSSTGRTTTSGKNNNRNNINNNFLMIELQVIKKFFRTYYIQWFEI